MLVRLCAICVNLVGGVDNASSAKKRESSS